MRFQKWQRELFNFVLGMLYIEGILAGTLGVLWIFGVWR